MSNNQQNMITQGTILSGDIISEGDFRVEGTINGSLKTSGKIVVGKTGMIDGSVDAENADFEGGFTGKLKLNGTLVLRSSAYIEGEVIISKLSRSLINDFGKALKSGAHLTELRRTKIGEFSVNDSLKVMDFIKTFKN